MKQESTNLARGSLYRWFLTLALMIVSVTSWGKTLTASAVVDCGEIDNAEYTVAERKTLYKFTASKSGILNVSYGMTIYFYPDASLSDKTLTYTTQVTPVSYNDDSKVAHYSIKENVEAGKEYFIYVNNKKSGSTLKFGIEEPTFVEMEADKEYTTPDIADLTYYKITAAKSGELTITNTNKTFTVRSGVTSTSVGTVVAKATANSDGTAYTYTCTVTKGQELFVQIFCPGAVISYSLVSDEPDEPEYEGTEMLLDTDYEISGVFEGHLFHLIPTESGKIVVKANDGGVVPRIFTDAEHTAANEVTSAFSYTDNGGQRVFEATAGVVYYLYTETNSSTTKIVRAEMLKGVEFVSVSPEAGTVFDINGTGELSVKFNMSVNMSEASLTCGTVVKTLTRESSGLSILFHIKTMLGEMLQSGAAKADDKFTVKITGICDATDASNVYGDDGTYSVEYIMPEMPMTLESQTTPDSFLSYWAAGDEAGKLVLTFSEDIYSGDNENYKPTADLRYGNLDKDNEGEYYYETVPVTYSGKTLTLDFTDKIRTPKTMLPNQQSDSVYTVINVKVSNIRDAEGNLCYTNKSATTGSFTFSMPYELVDAGEVSWEWTPASGAEISDVDNIELFIAGVDALRYDGVSFAFNVDGVADTIKVDNSNITFTKEEDEGCYSYYIPVPAAAQTAKNVNVFPTNLVCIDGIDRDIRAIYNLVSVEVVIGKTGYATLYYSDVPLKVPEGVDAWTFSVNDTELAATKSYPAGTVIPAGEAVVLRTQEPATYEFAAVVDDGAEKAADNALKGTDEAETVTATDGYMLYILGNGSEGIGFYQASEDGTSFTNGAHKAYLEAPYDAEAKFFSLDGTSTGISSIDSETVGTANIYNLQGQKLQNMSRSGLYIVDGKKVVLK